MSAQNLGPKHLETQPKTPGSADKPLLAILVIGKGHVLNMAVLRDLKSKNV
jgi:hypothetical protein